MLKLILLFLGIIMILIGYYNIRLEEQKEILEKKNEKTDDIHFKNAGIGTSEEILKQTQTWENQFEEKPGEIFDNIFNDKVVGLLSS
jgi:predicted membrane protein